VVLCVGYRKYGEKRAEIDLVSGRTIFAKLGELMSVDTCRDHLLVTSQMWLSG